MKVYRVIICSFVCCAIVSVVGGCSFSLGGGSKNEVYYVLGDDLEDFSGSVKERDIRLLVGQAEADRFVDSHRIIFSKVKSTRGYYRYASWVETPTRRFSTLLGKYIESSKLFRTVTRQNSSVKADVLLRSEFLEFYHDVASTPGRVKVSVVLELVDLKSRLLISRRYFVEMIPVSSNNANSAVDSFEKAIESILSKVVYWLNEAVPADVRDS